MRVRPSRQPTRDLALQPSGYPDKAAASHQDEGRLLQGWKAQRDVSERRVRLPRLWIPTAAGPELSKRGTVLQLHTRGQFLGTESHAGGDPGLEHPATDTV